MLFVTIGFAVVVFVMWQAGLAERRHREEVSALKRQLQEQATTRQAGQERARPD